jgi:carbamoyltransferase
MTAMPLWFQSKLHLQREMDRAFGGEYRGRYIFADHHESHAASAFFPSPFEEAAILTLDGVGEWSTTTLGYGQGNRVKLTHEIRFPHSLGLLYSAFTYYTGFRVNSGEYKLMGLAPYGEPRFRNVILEKLIHVQDDGSFWMDMSYFDYCRGTTMTNRKFHDLFGRAPRDAESFISQLDMDLAASVQSVCEDVMLKCARHLARMTKSRNLVMAGGVALNCVGNGKILREGPFENLWIQPAAGDAGSALGVAQIVWHHVLAQPRTGRPMDVQQGSLLGPEIRDDEARQFLERSGAAFETFSSESQLIDCVTDLLASGKVVGWAHGRMEFGPRALGARSILADPRSPSMQSDLNLKIKFRESFRPFAPCVLREDAEEYFALRQESPYMLLIADVLERHRLEVSEDAGRTSDPDLRKRVAVPRSSIPAVTHVDYSARIQTVDEERHGRFYRLLKRFKDKTGCPVLINTSFNIRGEPIVCTPQDAYRCFLGTKMDVLVLGSHVLMREHQAGMTELEVESYKASFALD